MAVGAGERQGLVKRRVNSSGLGIAAVERASWVVRPAHST